jgi:hypothetical protein
MAIAQFRYIVFKLASQKIQLHFGMLNLFRQKSSSSNPSQLIIA